MQIEVGQLAPEFSLFNTEKEKVSLFQLRGENVLILFFPLAFTSVCTAELCAVRDNMKIYESLHVKPLGISVDSLYTLAKFKQEQNLNFPLLSDFNKTVSKLYGSLYENFGFDMQGVSKRSAFLIDTEGIVRYAEVLENAGKQQDFQALQVKLREMAR
jgi:glutaredoxin-dependent peroxiredoxin